MDLDRLIHEKKHFAELEDSDVETFLRERKFGSEHLNIEFKTCFPEKANNKYEIRKICKYVVGFSNEEGGFVIYGVADDIKKPTTPFPDYIAGLKKHPSLEDLSLWVKDRIHPLVASPAIRFFNVTNGKVAVLKIPSGVNKPYFYHESGAGSIAYFKKTAGGVVELTPEEIGQFYRTQIIAQSQLILQASGSQKAVPAGSRPAEPDGVTGDVNKILVAQETVQATSRVSTPGSITRHRNNILAKLEDPKDFGLVQIYCHPLEVIELPVARLTKFLEDHRFHFSEAMRYFRQIETFQNGVSVGYFPNSVRQDVKSTMRISLYSDGFTAFDSLADTFLDGDKELHSGWLCYELQRQLQISKAVLAGSIASRIHVELNLEYIAAFHLVVIANRFWGEQASYTGAHQPIERDVDLVAVHDYDGEKRNIVMPVVRDIMEEVGRIFGLSQVPPNLWDDNGVLTYVEGLESHR
ncbi:MAG: ATP-binding protein [Candidatus Sulfotelmatobacter sp.]